MELLLDTSDYFLPLITVSHEVQESRAELLEMSAKLSQVCEGIIKNTKSNLLSAKQVGV